MYDRQLKSPDIIFNSLVFTTPDCDSQVSTLWFQMFQLRVRRWLNGTGHPRSFRGVMVGKETYARNR